MDNSHSTSRLCKPGVSPTKRAVFVRPTNRLPSYIAHAVELEARIALACDGLGMRPSALSLDDLTPEARARFMHLGELAWIAWLNRPPED